jgi:hypothetical protein
MPNPQPDEASERVLSVSGDGNCGEEMSDDGVEGILNDALTVVDSREIGKSGGHIPYF